MSETKGEPHYLWRAVEQAGHVLGTPGQRRRDKQAAKQCFRKLLKRLPYVPRVILTDNLDMVRTSWRRLSASCGGGTLNQYLQTRFPVKEFRKSRTSKA